MKTGFTFRPVDTGNVCFNFHLRYSPFWNITCHIQEELRLHFPGCFLAEQSAAAAAAAVRPDSPAAK